MVIYLDIIRSCILFSGLNSEDYDYALRFFSCRRKFFEKGQILKEPGSALSCFGLVLSGNIQVGLDDIDGRQMILATVSPGDTFGESLCFLGRETGVYIQAASDSSVLTMSTDRMRFGSKSPDPRDAMLTNRFTAMLASRTLAMNDRLQILSRLTIREKLITFFSQWAVKSASHSFTIPFDRATMASYLGTDRSALSRELSKMRREGLIAFEKNMFTINFSDNVGK